MTITLLAIAFICGIALWMLFNPKTKNNDVPVFPTVTPTEEPNRIEEPVSPDPEPTQIPIIPIDDDGEMPIKPLPVSCQRAIFRPAPEKYFYTDCCGNLMEGEGYQPWEKRSPITLDSNKPFEGMDLLGEEVDFTC